MKNDDYGALVALDWGDKTHAFARQMAGAEGIERGTIAATPEALHAWLEQLRATCQGQPVALAVEAGRNALLHALLEYPWLTVYPVHPATSARFRTAFTPSGAKDDGPDAVVILTLLRVHRAQLQPLVLDTPATRELTALVVARRSAVDQRTRTANQLGSVLKGYFPQALVLAGDDLTKPLARAFLRRFPELAAVQKVRPATLGAFYHKHHGRSAARIAERLELAARARPLHQDRAVIAPAMLEMALLVDLLEVQARHIAGWEARIAEVFAAHPQAELFAALPGAGPVLAPRLLVAFGDQSARYPTAASLQKYAGVAPVREKSGRQIWIHWRWAAPKFLRQSFVEWAGQTVVHCDWAHAYYHQQCRAGKAHHAVLRALAFKWIRILWRCWHDQKPYDEPRYLAALHRHGSSLLTACPKTQINP
jgi:transposase